MKRLWIALAVTMAMSGCYRPYQQPAPVYCAPAPAAGCGCQQSCGCAPVPVNPCAPAVVQPGRVLQPTAGYIPPPNSYVAPNNGAAYNNPNIPPQISPR